MVMDTDGVLKCGALLRVDAELVGVKLPVKRWPLACAENCQNEYVTAAYYLPGRNSFVVWPNAARSVLTRPFAVSKT
jgi:hypothetical protein